MSKVCRISIVMGLIAMPHSASALHGIRMTDVTAESGIEVRHFDGSCGRYYIVEAMAGGLALLDFDQDGDIDIYLLNGADQCDRNLKRTPINRLYENVGAMRFRDVTRAAGVGDAAHGLGVAVADYDNDGDPDIYVNNFGPNRLYRNNGDGTFDEVAAQAGVVNGHRVGAGACFLDIDKDGDVDLYVGNYIHFDSGLHVARTKRGYPIYGAPSDYRADADTLYRNNGDGTFTDISKASGVADHAAPSMGLVAADYDQDGDVDVMVGNDGTANYLFQNDGNGRFQEVGLIKGFAYDMAGKVHASMGVDCADVDNDGWLDFHVTSYQSELATLYRNVNGLVLEDITQSSRAGVGTRAPVTWGNALVDLDNDGHRDIFIACGHLYDQLEAFDETTQYRAPNVLLYNLGGDKVRFQNITDAAGSGMQVRGSSRGVGFDDLDNDGDLDAVILNSRQQPTILRNDTTSKHNWLQIRLEGTQDNRDAVGARVELIAANNRTWVDEVHSGRGYQSHFGTRLHFGLGDTRQLGQVTVRWPGGQQQVIRNVSCNRQLTIRQSAGQE